MTSKVFAQVRLARLGLNKAERAIEAGDMLGALGAAVDASEEAQELAFRLRKFVPDRALPATKPSAFRQGAGENEAH